MSVVTVVTRIFPLTSSSVDTSHLLKPSDLGNPVEVHKYYYVDPRTDAKYMIETTFCIGKTSDLGNLKAPGLIPLTSLNSALNREEDYSGREYELSIPRNIPLHRVPQLAKAIYPEKSTLKQQPSIKLHLNLKKIREAVKKKNLIKKKEKLVQPLFDYFIDGECLICGAFVDKSENNEVSAHMFTHIKLGTYACQSCKNKCFSSAEALFNHSIQHPEKNQYNCDVCGLKFNRKHFLSTHYKKEHPSFKSKPIGTFSLIRQNVPICFMCSYCKIEFNSWKLLIDHKKAHFGKESYLCLFCYKTFSSSRLLRYHTHVRFITKRHQCKSCHKNFSTSHKLQEHEKIHSKKHLFLCEVCGKKFHFKRNLSEHIQLLHS